MSKVLYICDGKACNGYCDSLCKYTTDISHADYFTYHEESDTYVETEKDHKISVLNNLLNAIKHSQK